eukprot:13660092-Alexandrium_andersonii.AAC.1
MPPRAQVDHLRRLPLRRLHAWAHLPQPGRHVPLQLRERDLRAGVRRVGGRALAEGPRLRRVRHRDPVRDRLLVGQG